MWKLSTRIPIYYYENEDGHKIIDEEEMRKHLEVEIVKLKLETKPGRRELGLNKIDKKRK